MANLERNLDSYYRPQALVVLDLMLDADSFEEAVETLIFTPMTSPSHFIVGGIKGHEGVVISRDFDKTVNTRWLSDDDWFVVQTNSDVWTAPDTRYENAYNAMIKLTQSKVETDGKDIIENVLFDEGVIQDDTIFTSTISAHKGQPIVVYDSPSHDLPEDISYAWHFAIPSESFAQLY